MSNKIVIVTAFFDIGRENFNVYPRSSNTYIEQFKFWARIRNDLVIYCQPEYYDIILEVRKNYGLSNKTKVIVIDNIYKIEPEIYNKMCLVSENNDFKNFRYYNQAVSNIAKYNYTVFLKYWCLKDAAKLFNSEVQIAWVDFGYNHGNEKYTNCEDFDFYWEYDFPDKVNAFCLKNPDEITCIDSLQFQTDCFIGGMIVLPQSICSQFWKRIKEAMEALLLLECIDDDQQLLLMVYKKYSHDFSIIICDWFDSFVLCSHQKFHVKEKKNSLTESTNISVETIENRNSVFLKIRHCLGKIKRTIFVKKTSKVQEPVKLTPKQNFLNRMSEKCDKYYG